MTPYVQCPLIEKSAQTGLVPGHMIFRLASALRPNRSLLGTLRKLRTIYHWDCVDNGWTSGLASRSPAAITVVNSSQLAASRFLNVFTNLEPIGVHFVRARNGVRLAFAKP